MPLPVNKQAIASAFGRAAAHYDQHASLQRTSGDDLMALAPADSGLQVLDAGCGTGWFSRQWQQRGHQVLALDLSPAMLRQARLGGAAQHYVQGDIERLPLATASVDLVFSNLAVQWCDDLQRALRQMARVTRPGGRVLFSTLRQGSLAEVHQAWRGLDSQPHANQFLSADAIASACHGLDVSLHQRSLTLAFPSALAAMRSLKGIGATHLHQGRLARGLGRQHLHALERGWPRDARGYLLTWQLIYGVMTR